MTRDLVTIRVDKPLQVIWFWKCRLDGSGSGKQVLLYDGASSLPGVVGAEGREDMFYADILSRG